MSYKIERVLNNNAVVSKNDKNEEIIITGPGIAFGKKYGGYVSNDKVDMIYKLQKTEDTCKLIDLFESIPNDYITLVDKVIGVAESKYNLKLNEGLYLALSDHINNAVERYKQGVIFENKLLWEIRNIYQQEFKLALEIIELIEKLTRITLPEDEAAFIALHIVNAEAEYHLSNISALTKRTKDILRIIELHFSKQIDKESIEYHRLLTHIKFFVNRVLNKKVLQIKENDQLYKNMVSLYPSSRSCIEKISNYLMINEDYELKEVEKLYLLIHLSRLYEL